MFFDSIQDVNSAAGLSLDEMNVKRVGFFPETADIGTLVIHSSYGLCVYTHNDEWEQVSQSAIVPGVTMSTAYGTAQLVAKRQRDISTNMGTELGSLASMSSNDAINEYVAASALASLLTNGTSRLIIGSPANDVLWVSKTFATLEADSKMVIKPSSWDFSNITVFHWEDVGTDQSGLDYEVSGFDQAGRRAAVFSSRMSAATSMWDLVETSSPLIATPDSDRAFFNDINFNSATTTFYWITQG